MNMFDLTGKKAIVTGGASGLGSILPSSQIVNFDVMESVSFAHFNAQYLFSQTNPK